MPTKAKRPCRAPLCPNLTLEGYCEQHKALRSNWSRDRSAAERGYGAEWLRLRKRIMERDKYLCQVCHLLDATEVDHIVPKAQGGTDDEPNLQAICHACHASKTRRERAA